jgi:signal transduction histidine kinase
MTIRTICPAYAANCPDDNSDRLVRLVNDILDLERLESGKVNLTISPCPIADLMQQSIDTIQPLADRSSGAAHLGALSGPGHGRPRRHYPDPD